MDYSPRNNKKIQVLSVFGQTKLLFRKIWLTKKRQEMKKLMGEILLPIGYLIILCLLVLIFNIQVYPEINESYEVPQNIITGNKLYNLPKLKIHVSPDNSFAKNFTQNLMQSVWKNNTHGGKNLLFEYYKTEKDIQKQYEDDMKKKVNNIMIALILPNHWNSSESFPYVIRMNPDLHMPLATKPKEDLKTCRNQNVFEDSLEDYSTCPVNGYYFSSFLTLQSLVEQSVMKLKTGSSISNVTPQLTVTMENYPKDKYNDEMSLIMRVLIPTYSVIPLAQIINNLLVLIVTDKEQKIKDGLRMIGFSDAAYWFSWLGIYGLFVTMFSIVFTLMFYFAKVLSHLNPGILFLLFFTFGLSGIAFAFALTPFFHKPKTAGLVGFLVIQVVSYLFLIQTFFEGSGEAVLMALRLISSLAFTTALDEACKHEYSGGISWGDLIPGEKGDHILYSLIFLVFDFFLYGFIAYYFDNVMPNEFGVRKHPLFCFQPSYWRGEKDNKEDFSELIDQGDEEDRISLENDTVEPVSEKLRGHEAIRIRNIKKTYTSWCSKKSVKAVKDVSMDIYDGQITAILGRNGAGKSTLFHILTGLVSPTSGKAVIFGLDSSKYYDMKKLQKMTGVCLQYDLHFNALTVEEHLEFYGQLRGLQNDELREEIRKILTELKLNDKRKFAADQLSGGQRRKLSVAIALIGDPKVILLDEPSAGLDPVSRRHLWSILQSRKEGKVILLTSHFMDEADVLADRKAIIHDGVLRCMGSSLFLKNRFGVGYYLTVETKNSSTDVAKSDAIIERIIPVSLPSKKVFAHEIKYSLPHAEASKFPAVFAEYEAAIQSGESFKSYGVSLTTLEDVFLSISNDIEVNGSSENDKNHVDSSQLNNHVDGEKNLIEDFGDVHVNKWAILCALSKLRMYRLIRSPQSVFFMLMLPLILVACALAILQINSKIETVNFVELSNPKNIYPSTDLRVAVHEQKQHNMSTFLKGQNIQVVEYSGNFGELLKIPRENRTFGAMSILKDDENELNIAMRVNGSFVHSPGIILDLITKYMNWRTPETNRTSTSTSLTYRPFPKWKNVVVDQASIFSAFLLGPAFTLTSVGMVMEIVLDREIKAKNHLRVNGLSFGVYFTSIFAVYGAISFISTLGELFLIWIFQVEALVNPYATTVVSILLTLYIIPSLLCSAIFSYGFNRMESAQSTFSQVAAWSGSIVFIIVFLVDIIVKSRRVVHIVHGLASLLCIFYVPYGIFYWNYKEYLVYKYVHGSNGGLSFEIYNTPEIWLMGIMMLIQIPVFYVLLIIADVLKSGGRPSHALASLLKLQKPKNKTAVNNVEDIDTDYMASDNDVVNEESRVSKYFAGLDDGSDNCVVSIYNLKKNYKKNKKLKPVLKGLSFMVEKGEVFGLLGHNGCGKTTTMKMITAEESPDSGKIHLCGYDIKSSMSKAFMKLGFCPQHDALWDNITLSEHLELYATIRGIQASQRKKLVEHFLDGLHIREHATKATSKLSGGTKRKLSYAMSMLGAPQIVLLDEPSTGMDPQSKRFLWNTVLGTFKESRGAILTTHSMEEADVLCNRIAIMVKGSILCIGSPQHLKNKFGTGYTMEIKLNTNVSSPVEDTVSEIDSENLNESHRSSRASLLSRRLSLPLAPLEGLQNEIPQEFKFIIEKFPTATLVEIFGNRAVFSVPNTGIQSISQAFAVLEQLKAANNVEEYSFSQTTLEQVFLTFTKFNDEYEEN